MLFLAGNTNKALCSPAILAVLDAIPSGIPSAIPSGMQYLQGSKKRDGGSKFGGRDLNGESGKETMLSKMRVSG